MCDVATGGSPNNPFCVHRHLRRQYRSPKDAIDHTGRRVSWSTWIIAKSGFLGGEATWAQAALLFGGRRGQQDRQTRPPLVITQWIGMSMPHADLIRLVHCAVLLILKLKNIAGINKKEAGHTVHLLGFTQDLVPELCLFYFNTLATKWHITNFTIKSFRASHSVIDTILAKICGQTVVEMRRSMFRSSDLVLNSLRRSFSTTKYPIRLRWLDLRASGLSMLERLSLEEALLRHTSDNWIIAGTHEPFPHKFLRNLELPSYFKGETPSSDCLVVMGIGGKPELLLNTEMIKDDKILVCKRFSGGGTVVLDSSSLWTTAICRSADFSHVQPYPKDIMEWSAAEIFGPTFEHMSKVAGSHGKKTLVLDGKSCSATENLGQVLELDKKGIPKFSLRENDYVFGDLKMGGNAQSIIKDGWLHHTSFLWDFDADNMLYLKLPQKRPDYRGDRSHEEFLVKLQPYYGTNSAFFTSLLQACEKSYEVEKATLHDCIEIVDEKLGGMEAWWDANRTRIVSDL